MSSESQIYFDTLLKASRLTPAKESRYRRLVALDPKLKPQIEAYLSSRLQRMGMDINNLPPFELVELERHPNGILIGNQIIDRIPVCPFELSNEKLIDGNSLILGTTKSGKSNFMKNTFAQIGDSCTVWCFDFMNEYRQLLRVNPKILVINWKSFRWNMIRPSKYIDQSEWIHAFIECYGHSFGLLTGSKTFTHVTLTKLIEIFSKEGIYPTLNDYVDYLKNLKLSRAQYSYLPVNLIRFESICISLGEMIDVQKGYLDELIDLDRGVVFELSGLVEAELQNFFVELMMTALFLARKK